MLGPERRRQDDHDPHDHRLPAADRRAGHGRPARTSFERAARGPARARLPAGERRALPRDAGRASTSPTAPGSRGCRAPAAPRGDRRGDRALPARATCADQIIGTLSKGYRQRVGLATAILHDPRVLVLDEPTVGLDPKQIIAIRELIRELGRERTLLLSTHILPEVELLCDRVLIIDRGRIVAAGHAARACASSWLGNAAVRVGARGRAGRRPARRSRRCPASSRCAPTPARRRAAALRRSSARRGGDPREAVFRLAVERGWVLLELAAERGSLEDIFVRLTTRDDAGEAAGRRAGGAGAAGGPTNRGGAVVKRSARPTCASCGPTSSRRSPRWCCLLPGRQRLHLRDDRRRSSTTRASPARPAARALLRRHALLLADAALRRAVLTMRLLSEELRSGSIEVLMTAPVTEAQVVPASTSPRSPSTSSSGCRRWSTPAIIALLQRGRLGAGRRRLPRHPRHRRALPRGRPLRLGDDAQPARGGDGHLRAALPALRFGLLENLVNGETREEGLRLPEPLEHMDDFAQAASSTPGGWSTTSRAPLFFLFLTSRALEAKKWR